MLQLDIVPTRNRAAMPARAVDSLLDAEALRGLRRLAQALGGQTRSLSDELKVWYLSGYVWGRHIYTLARVSPVRSRHRLGRPAAQPVEDPGVDADVPRWNSSCYLDGRHGGEG